MHSFLRISAIAAALSFPLASSAVVLTGTYATTGVTTGTGPWNLTSTDSTFSTLRFIFDTPIAFQNITSLSYVYDSNLGGIGGGAPRAVFVLDNSTSFTVHWGPAGSFIDATVGNNLNTGNLLALNDVGRYDLGGIGGSAYTDRNAALALAGNASIVRISLVIDSFGGANRDFDIHSVNVEGRAASVPDAGATALSFGFALLALLGFRARGWRREA